MVIKTQLIYDSNKVLIKKQELYKETDLFYKLKITEYISKDITYINLFLTDNNLLKIKDYTGVFFVDDEELTFLKSFGFDITDLE